LTSEERLRVQALFLNSLATSGIILHACRTAGVARQTIDYWREHDAKFAERYAEARADADDVIRAEIQRRAIEGFERRKSLHKSDGQGGLVLDRVEAVTEYSDLLLIFLAKSRMPEFRERGSAEAIQPRQGESQPEDITDEMVAAAAAVYERRTGKPAPDFSKPFQAPAIVDGIAQVNE
jgi:hypothetical protein